jgi:hypothetical protein
MFERIDTWIGKTLFVPLIIRICQHLGCTQYRVNRVCWFIAALVGFYFAHSVAMKVFSGVFAILCCLTAGSANAHYPTVSWRWFRLSVLALLAVDVFVRRDWGIAYDTLVLFAEYASTIRTIPPLEAGRKQRAYKPAMAKR